MTTVEAKGYYDTVHYATTPVSFADNNLQYMHNQAIYIK
jgi:hypothetical protein